MKLIVLGASGRCGSWVVRLANERGHDVTAVVREESDYAPPSDVTPRLGQVTDPAFVRSSLADHRTIISCLGLRRGSLSPWARVLSPPNIVQSVMRHVIDGMSDGSRLIWISAGGVGSSEMQASALVRRMIRLGSIGVAYRDLEAAERLIERAEINSLAVRPVTLVNGAPTGNAGPVDRYGLLSTVRRSDVAQWMLDVADGTRSYEGKTVLLGRKE
ncbi:MAG: NAD(P)H-binding protein [Phycisphaerales bacterium]